MRVIPIPDELAQTFGPARHNVIAGPDGDLTSTEVGAVDSLIYPVSIGGVETSGYSVLVELEPGELEQLQKTGRFWLTQFTPRMVVFSVGPVVV